MIHHLLGRPRDAVSRLESAASLHPRRPVRGLIQLVRAALHLLHEHDALGGLKRLERAADAGGHPLADRLFPPLTALALAEAGYTDEAATVLSGAPAGTAIVPFVLARILHQDGELNEAAAAYREALETLPEGYDLHRALTRFHLGRVYLEVGRVQQGSQLLHEALRAPLPKPYRSAVPHLAVEHEIG
jgi:tetratricopeptide (TPR) repeat protein